MLRELKTFLAVARHGFLAAQRRRVGPAAAQLLPGDGRRFPQQLGV